jgi:hypothetical protein
VERSRRLAKFCGFQKQEQQEAMMVSETNGNRWKGANVTQDDAAIAKFLHNPFQITFLCKDHPDRL